MSLEFEFLQLGLKLHKEGKLEEAGNLYRQILQDYPDSKDGSHLLGAMLVQSGQASEAVELLERAIARHPHHAALFTNLGTAHSRLGQLELAADCYRKAISIEPKDFDANKNLGTVLVKMGKIREGADQLAKALELAPISTETRVTYASTLLKLGEEAEAKVQFEQILQVSPKNRQALAGLGQILLKQPEPDERTLGCWQELAAMEPDNAAMHNNLATTLKNLKRFDEAEAACRRALELIPNFFAALCNLGLVLSAQNRFDEACNALRRAIEIGEARKESHVTTLPKVATIDEAMWREFGCVAYCQLAAVSNLLGNPKEAAVAVSRGLAIRPEDVESQMMQGFLHLQCGDFEKGWPLYEKRRLGKMGPRKLDKPEWTGEPLDGRVLLIHAEQGLGDSLHFIRYAKLVKKNGGKVHFLSHRPLAKFMRGCDYLDQIIADGDPLPPYDLQVPLLSMPGVYGTSFETVPREVPYLRADKILVEQWASKMSSIEGFRIGIAWQGNRDFANDELRRVPLDQFRDLANTPEVRLICLQRGDGTEQLEKIDFEVIQFENVDKEAGAFMDTAAIMENVDLIISPCTAVPHLAGGLGRPVWLAKSFAAEWRWMNDDREENPWYPTMTMFRQPKIGDWESVFQRMKSKLEGLLKSVARC